MMGEAEALPTSLLLQLYSLTNSHHMEGDHRAGVTLLHARQLGKEFRDSIWI